MPPDLTTIKVTKPLRERISTAAAQEHATVQNFLERVMDEHDRQRRLASVAAAFRGADEATLMSWRAETDQWAATDADAEAGLR
ncbi:hypothetical protein [Mycolicibacterium sp.]|uniref:hypothetical protein n=1 Tax=Mycolicibacterium sp. TaxID=2320850 RepID=UPI0037C60768